MQRTAPGDRVFVRRQIEKRKNRFERYARGEQQRLDAEDDWFAGVQEKQYFAFARLDQRMRTIVSIATAQRVLQFHTGQAEAENVRRVADVLVEKCRRLARSFAAFHSKREIQIDAQPGCERYAGKRHLQIFREQIQR